MSKNKTAVDFLFEKLWDEPKDKFAWFAILKQAKEMEKEQIISAHIQGNVEYTVGGGYWSVAEQYYKETYGDEQA